MWSVVIPLALGAAVSPTLLAATIVLLSGKFRPIKRSLLYLFGAAIPLILMTIFIYFFAGALLALGVAIKAYSFVIDIGIGSLLAVVGIVIFIHSRKSKKVILQPSINVPIKNVSRLLHSFILGFIMMSSDFSTFALFIPAEKDIFFSHQHQALQIVAVLVLIITTLLPVYLPIILYVLMPEKLEKVLMPFSDWCKKNGSYIAMSIFFIFSLYLFWKGFTDLHV